MNRLLLLIVIILLLAACAVKKQRQSTQEKQDIHQVESLIISGVSDSTVTSRDFLIYRVDEDTDVLSHITVQHGESITISPDGTVEGKIESITKKSKTKRTENSLDSSSTSTASRENNNLTATIENTESTEKEERHLDKKSHPAAIRVFIGLAVFATLIGIAIIIARKFKLL